jgi:hypothetical protein
VRESTFLFAHKIMENEGSCIEVFSASNFAFCGLADLLQHSWAAECSCEKNTYMINNMGSYTVFHVR